MNILIEFALHLSRLRSAISLAASIALATLAIAAPPTHAGTNATESTVVLRVVGTDSGFGQEPIPGWPNASPVKDAAGYSLYDFEIGWDNATPSYAKLYKFSGWKGSYQSLPVAQYRQYHDASTLLARGLADGSATYSERLSDALTAAMDLILQREQPTRFVVYYSGHGSATAFFQNTLDMTDAQRFLAYTRQKLGDRTLVLDFSTNCDVGYFDFAFRYARYADVLIASELPVGGFDATNPDGVTAWLLNQHDYNLNRFWAGTASTDQALDAIIAARQAVWVNGRNSLTSLHLQQSLVTYRLAEFEPLMQALRGRGGFDPFRDLPSAASDLGNYVYGTGDAALITAFEKFRIRYVSDRNLFAWTSDTRGLSVESTALLKAYLQGPGTGAPACTLTASQAVVRPGGSVTLTAACTPTPILYDWAGEACFGRGSTCTVKPTKSQTFAVAGVNAGGSGAPAVARVNLAADTVAEFYNPILDNYFITANAAEQAVIDGGGAGPGWVRTGGIFSSGGPTAVCRFYGSISPGPNSHFYTADPAECASLKQLQAATPVTQKRWNFESNDFLTATPANKVCAAGMVPIYRAYNNGFTRGIDSNHRITPDANAIAAVVAKGWSNEGVVMCAPGS